MEKIKSSRVRTMLILNILLKHSDAEHKINTNKLNEYLRPYGLECTHRVLRETVRLLREIGVDVRSSGKEDSQGVWLADRLLPDDELEWLIFAVTTNPHLSMTQVAKILHGLKPLVPVYLEDLLHGHVETSTCPDESLCQTYSTIHKAIINGYRVRYTYNYTKYNNETKSLEWWHKCEKLFTPKCFYRNGNDIYMIGYDNDKGRMDAVNLADIISIRTTTKQKDAQSDLVNDLAEFSNIVPRECQRKIYEGPVVFYCRKRYVDEIYRRFGAPDGPVLMDGQHKLTYTVRQAVITPETLFWLSSIPNQGIRIIGPGELRAAVEMYCEKIPRTIIRPLPKNMAAHCRTKDK